MCVKVCSVCVCEGVQCVCVQVCSVCVCSVVCVCAGVQCVCMSVHVCSLQSALHQKPGDKGEVAKT